MLHKRSHAFTFIWCALVVSALLGVTAGADSSPLLRPRQWTFFGPAPIFDGVTRFSGRIDVAVPDPLDPNVMYAGAGDGGGTGGGGVWKTTNWLSGNPIWQPLTDNLPSLSIFSKSLALFPGPHGGILYAAAQGPNGGILRSSDGGRHWKYLAQDLFNNALFGAVAVSPADSKTVYAAVGGNFVHGLYRSDDGGKNWSNITDPGIGLGAASDVVVDPDNPSILYTAIVNGTLAGADHGGIYKSVDGGKSWTPMVLPLPMNFSIGSFIALRMAPSDPNYVYATVFGSRNSSRNPQLQRFRTTDGGATWTLLTLPDARPHNVCKDDTPGNMLQDFRFWHVVLGVDPHNPDVVYANACEPTFVVSEDGGSSWREMPTVDDVVNVFFDDSDNLILTGDRGIHLSSNPLDPNPAFISMQGNLGNFLIHTLALDPLNSSLIDAVSQDQLSGIQYSGSLTWNYLTAGSEVGRFLINPQNDKLVYTWGFQNDIFLQRSEDGGQTWEPQMNGLLTSDFASEDQQFPYNAFALDPDNSTRLLLGGQHVWEAIDQGPSQPLSWTMLNAAPSPGNQISAVAAAPGTDAQTIYAGTAGNRFFVTTDGGTSWTDITPQPGITGAITTAIAIDPHDSARVFINAATAAASTWSIGPLPPPAGRVWMTTDGGTLWTNLDGDLPVNFSVHTLAVNFSSARPTLFAGTDRGVFWSRDLGKHWTVLKQGLPNVLIDDLELLAQTGVLAAGTFGRGVWQIALP